MTSRAAAPMPARVLERHVLSPHLVRLVLDGPGGFQSSGVPDEWVALTVPGQHQNRYYTVRSWDGERLVLDVVVHAEGLVTGWAQTECVGEVVGVSVPRGSYAVPPGAGWVVLVGDLTALPAMARITETTHDLPVTAYVEAPGGTQTAYPDPPSGDVSWSEPPGPGESGLAELVRGLSWPDGPGYFWMAGESAQMRDIRRHLRHEVGFETSAFDVMGYWSGSRGRRVREAQREVDPGPIWAAGKAAGKSDEEIWAAYDAARAGERR